MRTRLRVHGVISYQFLNILSAHFTTSQFTAEVLSNNLENFFTLQRDLSDSVKCVTTINR